MKRTSGVLTAGVIALGLVVLGARGCSMNRGSDESASRDNAAVRAVLEAQAAAWNRGDIEGYMDGYERSEQTTFVSGGDITRGWQTVLDRYKRAYDSREKMGTLAFDELEFKPVSEFYTLVTGRWQLTRAADTPHGRFTLLFRRTAGGWRIVHDHTSSAK